MLLKLEERAALTASGYFPLQARDVRVGDVIARQVLFDIEFNVVKTLVKTNGDIRLGVEEVDTGALDSFTMYGGVDLWVAAPFGDTKRTEELAALVGRKP